MEFPYRSRGMNVDSTGYYPLMKHLLLDEQPSWISAKKEPEIDPKTIVPAGKCPILEKTPLEIRRKIYSYLLISDDTSDCTCDSENNCTASVKFGLSPGIIGTCKQINIEASQTLYESNTLTMKCDDFTSWKEEKRLGQSTLTRHQLSEDEDKQPVSYSVDELLAFGKVQHWRVMIRPDHPDERLMTVAPSQVIAFCRAACVVPDLKSLLVATRCGQCIIKEDGSNVAKFSPDLEKFNAQNEWNLNITLKPFKFFRKLVKFEVKCPGCHKHIEVEDGKIAKLKALVESNEEVHRVFKTYDALLEYAQAFERIPLFRNDMDEKHGSHVSAAVYRNRQANVPPSLLNPYTYPMVHPVEYALRQAKETIDRNNYGEFKKHRLTVLSNLERQYIRMSVMSDLIIKHVEDQKKKGGCLGKVQSGYDHHAFESDDDIKALALIRLDDYAKTFTRDSPDDIRMSLRRYDWIMKCHYASLPRERHLHDLQNAYDMKDLDKFRESFCLAIGDMYGQWLEIRRARRKLMDWDWDIKDTGCKINLDLGRDDEPLKLQ